MWLVDDNIFERELFDNSLLNETHFIRRDADFKVLCHEFIGDDLCALLLGPCQSDNAKIWGPIFELPPPILQRRLGDDNEVRAGKSR